MDSPGRFHTLLLLINKIQIFLSTEPSLKWLSSNLLNMLIVIFFEEIIYITTMTSCVVTVSPDMLFHGYSSHPNRIFIEKPMTGI
jgi:hypothetical protein